MSQSFTLTTLKTALQNQVADSSTEFVAELDTIIKSAETRLLRDLRLENFSSVFTGSLTASQREQPIHGYAANGDNPRIVAIREVRIENVGGGGDLRFLPRRTYGFCASYAPDASVESEPAYWAPLDDINIYVVPTPDVAYQYSVRGLIRPYSLTDATNNPTGTSWLGEHAGDMLFYAALIASEEYLKDAEDEMMAKWRTSYTETLQASFPELQRLMQADYGLLEPSARAPG